MEDSKLIEWNSRGLIPGPKETEKDFQERGGFCLLLKNELLKEVSIPESVPGNLSEILVPVLNSTKDLYGISPDWVPVFFSNWRLSPWHGGAAWIFQLKENSPLGAILQLRKPFYKQKHYLGIYDRNELMSHEFAHVGRMAFEEKKYEELLAYRSSKKGFTRYFGPIIQSAFESRLIIYLLATLFLMDLYFLFQGSLQAYLQTQSFKLLPLALILFALYRLRKRQSTLNNAEKKLQSLTPHASAVLYRLTDKEITLFAKSSPSTIQTYIKADPSLRWKVIRLSYIKDLILPIT